MTIRITRAELLTVEIPLLHPFTISGGTVGKKQALLLRLSDASGAVGYGEAPLFEKPIYLSETITGAAAVLERFLLPGLLNREIAIDDRKPLAGLMELQRSFDWCRGCEFAKAAVMQAFCHITALQLHISLQTLLGGTQTAIPVGESLGIRDRVEEVVEEAGKRIAEGYKRIKLKIKPGKDIAVVQAVRSAHPEVPLMVDANSAYTLQDAPTLQKLDAFDLLMIEQPLQYDDIIDHAALQKTLKTPICLDESILCLRHARQAVEIGACRIINIKPSRVGGPLNAIAIHDWCTERGIPVWCGGMMESGIGRAFNIALASLPGFTLPADMSPSSILFPYDLVTDPYAAQDGMITVPTAQGLGFTPDERAIEKSTIRTVVLP
jgi:o-succinylbenzoate synthase